MPVKNDVEPIFNRFATRLVINKCLEFAHGFGIHAHRVPKEFYADRKADRTEHIQEIRLAGKVHNNKMERMNGELRDREKVMRTLENPDTKILSGMQIYHNYVRPHEALKGKTPSEAAGITVLGKNKWLTLIQNASCK